MATDTEIPQIPVKRGLRRELWRRWLALWPITVALAAYPVSNRILRIAVLFGALLLWTGLLGFYWRVTWLRLAALAVVMLIVAGFALPGRTPDTTVLRERYVHSLRSYEGTRYVWGGENRFGVDCSGLVRAGLLNASFYDGLLTLNPTLLRAGASLWWQDCSARALGEEYHQLTRHLFDAASLNQLDHSRLQPGDFAVTEDGVHVLAYLGEKNWIAADPDARRVLVFNVPATNVWFDSPVRFLRWRETGRSGRNSATLMPLHMTESLSLRLKEIRAYNKCTRHLSFPPNPFCARRLCSLTPTKGMTIDR